MWDVIIAGAGPAGAAAAYHLAQQRRRTLLVDDVDPFAVKIGEALASAGARLLRSCGLPAPQAGGPHAPIGGNLSAWGGDQLLARDFLLEPDGAGWRLDRARFDGELRAAAIAAGACYRHARVVGLDRHGPGWTIRLQGEENAAETALWLIDATGRPASIARRLGARRLRDAPLAATYSISSPNAADGFSPVPRLSRTLIETAPGGWWYAGTLASGAAIAGFHWSPRLSKGSPGRRPDWQHAFASTRHISSRLAGAVFGGAHRTMDASGARLDRYFGEGWIACGDAAQCFDPVSGQGIFSALHGGLAAARAVDGALDGEGGQLVEYGERLTEVRRAYVGQCLAAYGAERRWLDAPFWSTFGNRVSYRV